MQETTYPFRMPAPEGLGKVLFQRRGALFHALTACLFYWPLCLLALVGMALIVAKQGVGNVPAGVLVFGVLLCLGMGFAGYVGLEQYSLLRVHEGGLVKRGWGRTRTLLFEEIEAFVFIGGHAYARGAYLGPSYYLAFYPAQASGKRPLIVQLLSFRFTARQEYSDRELEGLRDWLYQVLSDRMRRQFLAGLPVDWVRRLRFLPEGLEHRGARKDKQVYPYASITAVSVDWQTGNVNIFTSSAPRPQIVEKMVRQPNDVPGLLLLDWLRRGQPDKP
jgi:hypothetical protein